MAKKETKKDLFCRTLRFFDAQDYLYEHPELWDDALDWLQTKEFIAYRNRQKDITAVQTKLCKK